MGSSGIKWDQVVEEKRFRQHILKTSSAPTPATPGRTEKGRVWEYRGRMKSQKREMKKEKGKVKCPPVTCVCDRTRVSHLEIVAKSTINVGEKQPSM